MEEQEKFELQEGNSELVESWIFSLIPIGVAFAFYVVFILQSGLENKNVFIAYGAAAGFVGLESYWIVQGWRQKRTRIVVMGVIGILLTAALIMLFF